MEYDINKARIDEFIAHTRTIGADLQYKAVSDYHSQLRTASSRMRDATKRVDPEITKRLPQLTSVSEMESIALNFLKSIDSNIARRAQQVLANCNISVHDTLQNSGSPTSKTTRTPDGRLNVEIHASKDIIGAICLAQELIDASVYEEYYAQKKIEDAQRAEFLKKTARQFFGGMMIKFLCKSGRVTTQQEEALFADYFRDVAFDMDNCVSAMDTDLEIYNMMYENDPTIFEKNLENYNAENFMTALNAYTQKPNIPSNITERFYGRIRDIAENGQTARYLMGDISAQLSGIDVMYQYESMPTETLVKLEESLEAQAKLSAVTGKTTTELVEQTPEKVENIMARENEREGSEQERVLERNRMITT